MNQHLGQEVEEMVKESLKSADFSVKSYFWERELYVQNFRC